MCHQFQKSGSGKAALSRLADLAAAETLVMSMFSFHRKRIQEQIHFFDLFSDVEAVMHLWSLLIWIRLLKRCHMRLLTSQQRAVRWQIAF